MRKTDKAVQEFRVAEISASQIHESVALSGFGMAMGGGCGELAGAIRDVYEKLEAMDRKLDAVLFDLARRR